MDYNYNDRLQLITEIHRIESLSGVIGGASGAVLFGIILIFIIIIGIMVFVKRKNCNFEVKKLLCACTSINQIFHAVSKTPEARINEIIMIMKYQ